MQQDIGNKHPAANLLAHGVTIEAARQGEPGSCFAGLAAEMQKLAVRAELVGGGAQGDAAATRRSNQLERRIETLVEHQQRLALLAATITASARQQTHALARAAAQARTQALHPDQAAELLTQVNAIETRQRQLNAAIESDRERLSSLLQACRRESDSGVSGAILDCARRKG